VTIINQALKIIGKPHVDDMLAATLEAQKYAKVAKVVGFDMVCEEDSNPPIADFVREIIECRAKSPTGLKVYLHAGESFYRENNQLIDAVLLDTKRIGHGYNLIQHPELVEMIKEKDICMECCPCSNKILGQILDTRCHPMRTLMQMGVPVSISSDDPGFWAYEGLTLDFVYAFVAWDLSLSEVKKLCLNSIKYSSIDEEEKVQQYEYFADRWRRWLNFARGRF
jgi:adenosine deaminase CECR1